MTNATWSPCSSIKAQARFRWTGNRARSPSCVRASTTRLSVNAFITPAPGQRSGLLEHRGGERAVRVDEDTRGARIGPTKGKVTPMPGAVQGAAHPPVGQPPGRGQGPRWRGPRRRFWLGANPGTLFGDGSRRSARPPCRGKSGKPVVTFPLPGVRGATAVATLDTKFMTERVGRDQGTTSREFAYSDYQDWNTR